MAPKFRHDLSLPEPDFFGYEIDTFTKSIPWWRQTAKLWAILATIVAVGSNLEWIAQSFEKLWCKPDVLVASDRKMTVAVGKRSEITFAVQNRTDGPCEVFLNEITAVPPSNARVDFEPRIIKLAKAGRESFAVPFVPLKKGPCDLKCKGYMTSGLLNGRIMLSQSQPPQVEAWDIIDTKPSCELLTPTENGAVYVITCHHGNPPDTPLNYQMSVHGGDDCQFVTVDNGTILNKSFVRNEADVLWSAKGTPLQAQVFTVSVESLQNRDEAYWKQLNVEINVDK